MGEQPVELTRKRTAAEKQLEGDDPYELKGVRYPVAPGVDADRETARTIVEEFALQGWSPEAIANLFVDPLGGHVHDIYRRRGDELLDELFDEVFGRDGAGR